jgi:hypothetical protein
MIHSVPNPRFEEEQRKFLEREQRAAHADFKAAMNILAKVPDRTPLSGDETETSN